MRKKLILINAGVVIVGLIAAFLLAMPQVQNLYKEEFARRLDTALAFMLSDTDRIAEDPQGFVEQEREILQQAGQDMRITIISTDGQVLGDSDLEHLEEPDPVTKNHLTRPEIYEAKHYGKGYDTRDSASLHESYYYAAVYVEGQFYLRAALPLTEMNRAMTSMQLCLMGGILLGCAVAVVLAFFSARSITRPLVKLTEATRHISEGDFDSRVEVTGITKSGTWLRRSTVWRIPPAGHSMNCIGSTGSWRGYYRAWMTACWRSTDMETCWLSMTVPGNCWKPRTSRKRTRSTGTWRWPA